MDVLCNFSRSQIRESSTLVFVHVCVASDSGEMEFDMKKLDLHIHTLKTISDHDFTFSMDTLKDYIMSLHIDGIAITNHNIFDAKQFDKIVKELEGLCTVLPGIEINLGSKGFGHMICITEPDDIEDFTIRCGQISEKINNSNFAVEKLPINY